MSSLSKRQIAERQIARVLAMSVATVFLSFSLSTLAAAQDQPVPRVEIFGGYSFVYPGADVHGTLPQGLVPLNSRLESNPRGVGASVTYNFNRIFGLTFDTSTHWGSGEALLGNKVDDAGFTNFSVGPKFTFRSRHFSPFLEVLAGDNRLMPEVFHHINKLGLLLGGGIDANLSRHVGLRLIRFDYVMSSYRYGPAATTSETTLRGSRLQTGLNFMFGGDNDSRSPTATCTAQPAEVFAGEPVTATAAGSDFNPKRTVKYNWSGQGLKVGGTEASTQIDTTGLAPGAYRVTANLSDGTRHGVASSSAGFTVKSPRPPEISCATDPATIEAGGKSTISSNASSPDGSKLTYGYTTSAGNIAGNTSTAVLDSTGAQPGTITVICNVSDDRNPPLTASSTATVTVNAKALPAPPERRPEVIAMEKRLALHSVYFATAKPSEQNPDAGLLPSQEKTLTALASDFRAYLQSMPDARLTLEGHADPRGSNEFNQQLSERRVDRAKRFLVEQGVPEANIQTKAFGEQQNLSDAQVKDAVERNPELSPEDRQKILNHMNAIILASNRRVDITLSNAGQASQDSVREYPFNAADSLSLLNTENKTKAAVAKRKKANKK
jgi:outer membrane protein OmpA-like peptidoglycan-associated protein